MKARQLMQRVIYSSPFVPPELIAAHGFKPVRMLPNAGIDCGAMSAVTGVCPYARTFVNSACAGRSAALVLTTACDQMRRASEYASAGGQAPVFLMNVPSTFQTESSRSIYRSELTRLGRFLVDVGGVRPSRSALSAHLLEHDRLRMLLRKALESTFHCRYGEIMQRYQADGRLKLRFKKSVEPRKEPVRISLLGGPITRCELSIFDLIRQFGGAVVLDGTEGGERTLPAPFESHCVRKDPFEELVRAYFDEIPDVFRRPIKGLYEWLRRETQARNVQGVVILRHVWCDKWHAAVPSVRELLDIPLLDVEMDGANTQARIKTRIQAFLEKIS